VGVILASTLTRKYASKREPPESNGLCGNIEEPK
jgi:hypothetical protein